MGGCPVFSSRNRTSKTVKTKALNKKVRVISARQALIGEKRQKLNVRIKELLALEEKFPAYCQSLIDSLVEFYQELPETRNSYFAGRGGLIDHAFSRTQAALSMCRSYFLKEAEALSEIQQLWLYTLFSASLLQGIGKLMIDLKVDLYDESGEYIKSWNPLHGSILTHAKFYRYEFLGDKPDDFRRRLNSLLARQLMPRVGFDWIANNKDVLEIWLALLNEDYQTAGVFGPIIVRADALAIERYFAEQHIRHFSGDAGNKRYSHLGTTFNPGLETNEANAMAGVEFVKWLTKVLADGKIMINKAPLWMVPGGLLMCPDLFKLFVREHPEYKNWQAVQKGFLEMKLHATSCDSQVIHNFEQKKNDKVMSGLVLANYAVVLPDKMNLINPHTKAQMRMSSTELIRVAGSMTDFSLKEKASSVTTMKVLSRDGQWIDKPAAESRASTKFDSNG